VRPQCWLSTNSANLTQLDTAQAAEIVRAVRANAKATAAEQEHDPHKE
jgi:hypothetical protein